MKTRRQHGSATVIIHAVLAGLALIFAYLTWTRDRTAPAADTAVALDVSKAEVTALQYEDDSRTVSVERRGGSDGEAYAWVTVKTRSKVLNTNPGGEPRVAMPPGQGGPPGMPPGHGGPPGMPPGPGAAPGAPGPHGMMPPGHGPMGAPGPHGMMPPGHGPMGAPGPHGMVPPGHGPGVVAPPVNKAATPVGKPGARPAPAKGGEKSGVDKNSAAAGHPPVTASAPAPTAAAPTAAAAAPTAAPAAPVAAAAAPGAPAAPAMPPPGTPVHEVKETITVKQFRGSDQADKLLELFAPLKSVRALGKVDPAKAKELGLTDSKKSLTITAHGSPIKFIIGSTSYGGGDSYVQDPEGRVFLISQRLVSDFEFAESRLMERRLHRFERADFDRLEITVGAKKRVLVQKNRQDPQNFYFAEEATPDKRDDTLKNWVEKTLRMAINDYVAQGDEPQAVSTAPMSGAQTMGDIVTMRFFDGRKTLGSAVLSRYQSPKTNQIEYFARTETTIGLVRLLTATAESAIQDAEKW